jgi:AcrR family transcriptional regulator
MVRASRKVLGKAMPKRKDRESEHPTRILIRSVASELLTEDGVEAFRVDDVLDRTGLTRGALYHHFDNVEDLLESALLVAYSQGVEATVQMVDAVLGSATTFEQFRAGVFRANHAYVANSELRAVRRLRAYAMANTADRLAVPLAAEQQRLTDKYVDVIVAAQRNGWVKPAIDPVALAVFIQAYSFGIIVDDVAETHLDPDQWIRHIEHYFDTAVFQPGSGD